MKDSIKLRSVVLLTSLTVSIAGIGVSTIFSLGSYVLIIATLATIVLVTLLITLWLNFVKDCARATSLILEHKQETSSAWSINGFDQLETNIHGLKMRFETSLQLIEGVGTGQFQQLAERQQEDNSFTQAIKSIQTRLEKMKEDEKQRTWINDSVAAFSEVLRNKCELKEYSYNIIRTLVKTLNANQAGLYIARDENGYRYLELAACYAYDKRKHVEARIEEGQGMLGQCMLDRQFVFLTDIPKAYVKITSGLGESTPRNIVIAPLIFNNQFCGALELAFFSVMTPHEIEFLNVISVSIAAEVASSTNIVHTQELLEQSKQLTEELQTREEEMKQQMEELEATQEEMKRKQSELSSVLSAIDATVATAEFDLNGALRSANEIFLQVMGYRSTDVVGKFKGVFMGDDQAVVMMWENLRLGKFFSGEFKMKDKNGRTMWLSGTFNPICITSDKPEKILMFAQFTTQEKEKVHELTGIVSAFKSTLPVVELNPDFRCKTANDKFLKVFGLNRMEIRSKIITDFIDPYYHASWKAKCKEIIAGGFVSLQIPIINQGYCTVYEIGVSVVKDLEGRISRIVLAFVKEVEVKVPLLSAV